MVKSRKQSRKQRRKQRRNQSRKQRGGGWAFDGAAGKTAGGVPFEARTWTDDCAYPSQRGGACGSCGPMPPLLQNGGGSGTGGFAVNVASNDMGKMYASVDRAPCPQRGGNAAEQYGISSYTAGYGLTAPVELERGARYMDYVPYGKACVGGARKNMKRRHRKTRRA